MNRKLTIFVLIVSFIAGFLFFKKTSPTPEKKLTQPEVRTEPVALKDPSDHPTEETTQTTIPTAPVRAETINPEEPRRLTAEEVEQLRNKTKSFMSALYVSQSAFRAEWDQYVTDVFSMMIDRYPVLEFKAGFLAPSGLSAVIPESENVNPNRMNTDFKIGEKDSYTEEVYQYAPFVKEIDLEGYRDLCKQGCTASKEGFEMLIATPLGNPNQVDVWIVNDKKEFILVKDGTQTRFE